MPLEPGYLKIVQILTLLIMSLGLVSLATLIIPGLTVIWLAALAYLLLTGINWASGICFVLITALMLFGSFVDQLLMGARAKHSGASWLAIGVSALATLVGALIFPPFGGILFGLGSIFVVEIIRIRDLKRAAVSTRELAVGCGQAFFARFGIGLLMIALWMLWATYIPVS